MGLYDTFIAPAEVSCPECGSALNDFQTKGLCEGMGRFKIGDSIHLDGDDLFINDGWLVCVEYCTTCETLVEAKALVTGGRYSGLEIVGVKR